MKKMRAFCGMISLALCVCCLVASCGAPTVKSNYNPDLIAMPEDLVIQTEFSEYSVDTERIQLILANQGNMEICYGLNYVVEVLYENDWYQVPLKEEAFFDAIGIILPAGETATFEVRLDNFARAPKPGKYRVQFNQMCVIPFELL